jgi:hypothetical protein
MEGGLPGVSNIKQNFVMCNIFYMIVLNLKVQDVLSDISLFCWTLEVRFRKFINNL